MDVKLERGTIGGERVVRITFESGLWRTFRPGGDFYRRGADNKLKFIPDAQPGEKAANDK